MAIRRRGKRKRINYRQRTGNQSSPAERKQSKKTNEKGGKGAGRREGSKEKREASTEREAGETGCRGSVGSIIEILKRKRSEEEQNKLRAAKELLENFHKLRMVGRSPQKMKEEVAAGDGEGSSDKGKETQEQERQKKTNMEQIADLIKTEMKAVKEDMQELLKQNKEMRRELRELNEEWKIKEEKWKEEKSARKEN